MSKAPASKLAAARKRPRPQRKFTTTRQWVQDEFIGWCADNNVDPVDGLSALRAYVEHRLPLEKNYSIKTVRIYIAGALEVMRGKGVDIPATAPEISALIEPFLNRDRETAPPVPRPAPPVRRAARGVGLSRLIEWIMNREDVPLAASVQDRALLLVGVTAGMTPDELVQLRVVDVRALPWSGVMLYQHKVDRFERESVEVFYWPYREPKALDTASALLEWLSYRATVPSGKRDSAMPLFADLETGKPLEAGRIVAYLNHAIAAASAQENARPQLYRGGKLGFSTIGEKGNGAELMPQTATLNATTPEKAFQLQARLWGLADYSVPAGKSSRAAKKPA